MMPHADADTSDCCWICLQDGNLSQPCKCPRLVHQQCLASWQLHCAGTREEVECRFCQTALTDWRLVLCGSPNTPSTVPVVAVVFGGLEYRLAVQPTPEGLSRFQRQVEVITGLPFTRCGDVRFCCSLPAGDDLQLSGVRFLPAAIHVAAVTAAERAQQLQHSNQPAASAPSQPEQDEAGAPAATSTAPVLRSSALDASRSSAAAAVTSSSSSSSRGGDSSAQTLQHSLRSINIVEYYLSRHAMAGGGSTRATNSSNNSSSSSSSNSSSEPGEQSAATVSEVQGSAEQSGSGRPEAAIEAAAAGAAAADAEAHVRQAEVDSNRSACHHTGSHTVSRMLRQVSRLLKLVISGCMALF